MKFKRKGRHYMLSEDGEFTIAAVYVGDCKTYEAYEKGVFIGRSLDPLSAEQLCRDRKDDR